jgi:alcohol dehydrogenase (cytochrome c)
MRHESVWRIGACVAGLLLAARLASSGATELQRVEDAQVQTEGKQLFAAQCATCHGVNGGGGERGPDIATARRATRPVEETVRLITEGIPAGGMPPSTLSAGQVTLVARYLRALAESARQPRRFPRVRLGLRDGRTLEGLVQNESNVDVQLLTTDGRLAALTRDEIAAVTDLGRAPMPDLSPREVAEHWKAGDWPTYNGDPGGNRHSRLGQITTANVAQMRLKWVFQAGDARNLRNTPVVVDGVMYVTAPNEVWALDARSGRQIWHYGRPRTQGVIGDAGAGVNRGVAVRGDRLYVVTDDARLLALHRANGQLLWDVVMADYKEHYGATSAPLVVNDLVISGVSGGDEGIRGFLAAFNAATGKEVWRFWTVPAPGEPGSETWKGRAIEHPCAATWLTGSYDAKTNLLFWTTGNPCPDYNGSERVGDNLWSNSVLALEPSTGKLRWYYQFTPHDLNDWDSVQTVIVTDTEFKGATRSLLMQANRNGFFYVLDRETGKLLLAEPFVKKVTWASGIGPDGRPQRIKGIEPSMQGTVVCPAVSGATNWMSPAFNPDTRLYYVMAMERCNVFRKSAVWFQRGESFYGGGTQNVPDESGQKFLRAIDVETGKIRWEYPQIGSANTWGGVLSTATGLVFFAEDSGAFAAVDAQTGKLLWQLQVNATWRGSPMTYMVGEQQYVAIAGGGSIFAFGL